MKIVKVTLSLKQLHTKRDILIGRLSNYRHILRGTIIQRGNICGKAGCRCKKKEGPILHGPYKYLSHRSRKTTNMIFLNRIKLPYVNQGVREYQELIELIYHISEINFEILRYHYDKLQTEV